MDIYTRWNSIRRALRAHQPWPCKGSPCALQSLLPQLAQGPVTHVQLGAGTPNLQGAHDAGAPFLPAGTWDPSTHPTESSLTLEKCYKWRSVKRQADRGDIKCGVWLGSPPSCLHLTVTSISFFLTYPTLVPLQSTTAFSFSHLCFFSPKYPITNLTRSQPPGRHPETYFTQSPRAFPLHPTASPVLIQAMAAWVGFWALWHWDRELRLLL